MYIYIICLFIYTYIYTWLTWLKIRIPKNMGNMNGFKQTMSIFAGHLVPHELSLWTWGDLHAGGKISDILWPSALPGEGFNSFWLKQVPNDPSMIMFSGRSIRCMIHFAFISLSLWCEINGKLMADKNKKMIDDACLGSPWLWGRRLMYQPPHGFVWSHRGTPKL